MSNVEVVEVRVDLDVFAKLCLDCIGDNTWVYKRECGFD